VSVARNDPASRRSLIDSSSMLSIVLFISSLAWFDWQQMRYPHVPATSHGAATDYGCGVDHVNLHKPEPWIKMIKIDKALAKCTSEPHQDPTSLVELI
jgi:hypothetical protein